MSDTNEPSAPNKPAFSALRLALTLAVVVLIAGGIYFYMTSMYKSDAEDGEADRVRKAMGLGDPVTNRLGEAYTDGDEDLVADTPKDAKDRLDPAELTFTFIVTNQPEDDEKKWQPFVDYLSQAVGRPVKYVRYDSRKDQLRAIRDGELHLAGLNTGAVPVAVNACGFVPVCAPGKGETAEGYKMVVIVPAGSEIESLKGLKGKRFAFTDPTSNSGCKAAIVSLQESADLELGEDYDMAFTHGHTQLIQAIANKDYVAGSTASNLLERAIQEGDIQNDAIDIIYESEPFPSAVLGMTYKLEPKLAAKIRVALESYAFPDGTDLAAEYATSGSDRLVGISYKDDFALIRRIDDAVGYDHQGVLNADDEAEEKGAGD